MPVVVGGSSAWSGRWAGAAHAAARVLSSGLRRLLPGARAAAEHELMKLAFEAMPDGVALFDARGRYVLWNARYAEFVPETLRRGLSFEAVLRSGVAKGNFPEAVGCEEAFIQRRLARRAAIYSMHESFREGRWLRVEQRRTADGGALATMVDITDLKRKEESFRLLFDANPAPMWVHEAETLRLLAVNDAAIGLFGYPREAFLGRTVWEFLADEELADARAGLAGRENAVDYHGERPWRFIKADGGGVSLLAYTRALIHEDRPARLMALWDVTDRLRVEEDLRRTRAFLDTVIDSIPVMLLVKGIPERRYLLWNRMAEEWSGVRREQVLGKTAEDVFPADEAAYTSAWDRAAEDACGVVCAHEGRVVGLDGAVRHIVAKRLAVPGPDGRPEFMVSVVEDMTERTHAAQTLARACEEADAANRAKSEFLANMSHEIRTPLNGVLSLAGVLGRSALDPSQREIVQIIESSAVTLERLLSDILDLARVESGRLEIVPETFDLGEAARSVAALCQIRAQEKGVGFRLEVDEIARRWVSGDASRLKQILSNLLNNALKFTAVGEVSMLVTREEGGPFRFVVHDTGIGFSAETKARLFHRFEQADGSITRRFGGSGLGLAICHQLASLMGGSLSADSVEGEGSTFVVELPLLLSAEPSRADLGAMSEVSRSAAPKARPPLRVLLAEDHPINRRVVELILQDLDVDLTSVENGREAADACREVNFDLVLMDMQMPVLDGLAATEEIRTLELQCGSVRTPVIMLSANAMPEHVQAARGAGADGYVTKPVKIADLLAEIDRLTNATDDGDSNALTDDGAREVGSRTG